MLGKKWVCEMHNSIESRVNPGVSRLGYLAPGLGGFSHSFFVNSGSKFYFQQQEIRQGQYKKTKISQRRRRFIRIVSVKPPTAVSATTAAISIIIIAVTSTEFFFNLDNENGVADTPRRIDRKDNVFIMSNPKSKYHVLQLDLRLISDLVVVIVSATCGVIAFASTGQPVITHFLCKASLFNLCTTYMAGMAGSIIGPGELSFVSEMVQVAY
ncbi:hypothetical protein AXX17_ATUG00700 [Arabidopsis thaliana]|uniref:Uncharacterized protein n=1 Tax=Arabidopsis thaliana TaxID=3702 RepID=A0A178U723_ARATH|nr:hypothetical protein AXX17_ATUG00700 [Arabidopsis thaliana]